MRSIDIPCPKFCVTDDYDCKYSAAIVCADGESGGTYCTKFKTQLTFALIGREEELLDRLKTYPDPPSHEIWRQETDLSKCTPKEKLEMRFYGTNEKHLMELGLNRGEVHHMLFGFRFSQ